VIPRRFDVHLIALDPARGSEIRKTRPCVVVSPDEMNRHLRTAIVAPMTSTVKGYPSRIPLSFGGNSGEVALDQLRTVDRERLVKRLGVVEPDVATAICGRLVEMFRE